MVKTYAHIIIHRSDNFQSFGEVRFLSYGVYMYPIITLVSMSKAAIPVNVLFR